MLLRQKYVCPSKSCRREIEIEMERAPSGVGGSATCTCGTKLKKAYATPVLFILNRTEVPQRLSEIEGPQASHTISSP